MAKMQVHWALRGALLHSLVTAMAISPLLNRGINLKQRCEIGLAGYACLELFRMVAEDICKEMQLPLGSCFLAGQSLSNLEWVAMSGVIVCVTKDIHSNPWLHGFGRLSEIGIEHHFGYLRQQSQNSQMTARQYFQYSARLAMQTHFKLNKDMGKPQEIEGEPALTEEEFLRLIAKGIFKKLVWNSSEEIL